jgi:hypothetical protein
MDRAQKVPSVGQGFSHKLLNIITRNLFNSCKCYIIWILFCNCSAPYVEKQKQNKIRDLFHMTSFVSSCRVHLVAKNNSDFSSLSDSRLVAIACTSKQGVTVFHNELNSILNQHYFVFCSLSFHTILFQLCKGK